MIKRILAVIIGITLIIGNGMPVLAMETEQRSAAESALSDNNAKKSYSLTIKNGILIGYKGTPVDVVVPKGVKEIKEDAFIGCRSLKSIKISSSVTKIGRKAFFDCANLEKVEIPASVDTINSEAFIDTKWLDVKRKENPLVIVNDILIDGRTCEGNEKIPSTVRVISEAAFFGCKTLTKIKIPSSVEMIGTDAFSVCSNLENIEIPTSVKRFGANVFYGTPWLDAKIEKEKLVIINDIVIDGHTCKGEIEIPAGVTMIGACAFLVAADLESVKIPSSVTEIDNSAFYQCSSLASIEIPSSVTKIGNSAFAICRNLTAMVEKDSYAESYMKEKKIPYISVSKKSIEKASVILSKKSYTYDGKVKKPTVTIKLEGKTLVKNTDYTVIYKNNKNIGIANVIIYGKGEYSGTISKNFTIKVKKDTTFTSGKYKYKVISSSSVAFNGIVSTKTKQVTIPKTVKYGGKTLVVAFIADGALKKKTKVTKVTIGENVKIIGASAFEGCKNLKTITIKSMKLKTVGKKALKGIDSNATIKVPKSKFTSYSKLLSGKGQGRKVKIKIA